MGLAARRGTAVRQPTPIVPVPTSPSSAVPWVNCSRADGNKRNVFSCLYKFTGGGGVHRRKLYSYQRRAGRHRDSITPLSPRQDYKFASTSCARPYVIQHVVYSNGLSCLNSSTALWMNNPSRVQRTVLNYLDQVPLKEIINV